MKISKQDLRDKITELENTIENLKIGIHQYTTKNDNTVDYLLESDLEQKKKFADEKKGLQEVIGACNIHIKIINLEKKILETKLGM